MSNSPLSPASAPPDRPPAGFKSVPLVLWLVKEEGADVNATDATGLSPCLHCTTSLDVLNVLLGCGADPTLLNSKSTNPLMWHVLGQHADLITRLLQDPRVQATVNVKTSTGNTALHFACNAVSDPGGLPIVQLLLQADADLTLQSAGGVTPLDMLQHYHPAHPTTLVLVEQSLDAERAFFLVKARRLVMAGTRTTPPSLLQCRLARGLPLPRVTLASMANGQKDEEDEEAKRKLRTMLAWLVGMEGGYVPSEVFRVVLYLLMPFWDPLRCKARDELPGSCLLGATEAAAALATTTAGIVIVGERL
jgi:hypothetical protein